MKKCLSIALAMVLALALFVSAFAAEQEQANPNAPIITRQPLSDVFIRQGRTVDLEIIAELPEGADGELTIAWFVVGEEESFATGNTATVAMPEPYDVWDGMMQRVRVYAVVTNIYGYSDDESASVTSNVVTIDAIVSTWTAVRMIWTSFFAFPWWLWPISFVFSVIITIPSVPIFLFANFLMRILNLFN